MSGEKLFWFILAVLNLITSVFSILYYRGYRKEPAMLAHALVFFLYSAWFILVAGLLAAPDMWLTWIGVALLGAIFLAALLLVWRVWSGDES